MSEVHLWYNDWRVEFNQNAPHKYSQNGNMYSGSVVFRELLDSATLIYNLVSPRAPQIPSVLPHYQTQNSLVKADVIVFLKKSLCISL
jgi:hypothetical protein